MRHGLIKIGVFLTFANSLYPLAFFMKLHYRKFGSGPVLIILHGLYGSSDNWITIARKLEDHYTVLLPDLRNHGASPHSVSHTYEDMVGDLVQFFHSRSELDDYFGSKIKEETVRLFLLKNIHRTHEGVFEWKINAGVLRDNFRAIVSETDLSWFEERSPITAYPVTFVRGLNSEYVSNADWKDIQYIYPDAKLVDFAGAGHWLHAEQPSKLIATILEKENL